MEPWTSCWASCLPERWKPARKAGVKTLFTDLILYGYIYPASRGGPPTPQVFGSVLVKILNMLQKIVCSVFFIVFLQHRIYLNIFGKKVGPKHRFLQCCFNLFFKNIQKQHNLRVLQYEVCPKHWFLQYVQYSNIPNPLKTSVFAVFFFHCCPFFRCRKPPKSVFRLPEPPQNDPKFHLNTLFRSNAQKSSEKLRKHQQRKGFGAKILNGPPS